MSQLENIKKDSHQVNPWKLFRSSEIILAGNLVKKITETLFKFTNIEINSISDVDKSTLHKLSDNMVPYEWRKLWQGPKLASDFLKSVATRIPAITKFVNTLDDPITDIDFAKIFNVDSFLSTAKLVSSRDLKISTSDLMMETMTEAAIDRNSTQMMIKIAPLLIDGLSFENGKLIRFESSASNYTSSIYLYYKETPKTSSTDDRNVFEIPLYATAAREKLLCTIKLSSSLERDEIIYAGTSLVVPEL